MQTPRNLFRHECNVFFCDDVLGGFENTSMSGFYFHFIVRERTGHYYFCTDRNHWVHDYDVNGEHHLCRRTVVNIEDITRDEGRAVEVITGLLINVDVTETEAHPRMIEKIYSKADWLARQFAHLPDKRIPIRVDIVKVYGQADIDPYYWLSREENAQFVAAHVARLSMDEYECETVPVTRSSIAALEKVKLRSKGEKCMVCLGGMRKATRMPCGHMFHGRCIVKWLKTNHVCPLCRFEMPADDVGDVD